MFKPTSPIDVLVVDDDKVLRIKVQKVLSDQGFVIHAACDGQEALEVLKNQEIQLVITDWTMPGFDGLELCRQIRQSETMGFIYIIMLTANHRTKDLVQAFDAGVDDFMAKPVSQRELVSRITAAERIIRLQAYYHDHTFQLHKVNAQMAVMNNRLQSIQENENALSDERDCIYEKMVQYAHRAGVAQMASNMLHEVGSVISNMHVTVAAIRERIDKSRINGLASVHQMIQDHQHDLPEFMAHDEKGKHLPQYLLHITSYMETFHSQLLEDVQAMLLRSDRLQEMISDELEENQTQGKAEPVELDELLDEVLSILNSGLKQHQIQVERDYDPSMKTAKVYRALLIQILMNLLIAAKHDMSDQSIKKRKLTIALTQDQTQQATIHIQTTGLGMSSERIEKIYDPTLTDLEPIDFKLQQSAKGAKDLLGSLSIHSDAPGQGVGFKLQLPYHTDPPTEQLKGAA